MSDPNFSWAQRAKRAVRNAVLTAAPLLPLTGCGDADVPLHRKPPPIPAAQQENLNVSINTIMTNAEKLRDEEKIKFPRIKVEITFHTAFSVDYDLFEKINYVRKAINNNDYSWALQHLEDTKLLVQEMEDYRNTESVGGATSKHDKLHASLVIPITSLIQSLKAIESQRTR